MLDYLVVDSGYTALLILQLGFNKVKLIKQDESIGSLKTDVQRLIHDGVDACKVIKERNLLDGIDDTDIIEFINSCIFIYDGVWGAGLYKIGDDDEVDRLVKILKDTGHSVFGLICFRCTNVSMANERIKLLRQIRLSRLDRHVDDEIIDKDGLRIMISKFN